MDRKSIERIISHERFEPYLNRHNGDYKKALEHYKSNIKITESFYPLIAVLEVGLRNNMNHRFIDYFKTKNWTSSVNFIDSVSDFQMNQVNNARKKILTSKKEMTDGRIVSELTFGFWTSFFDSKYELNLWKSLRLAFPNCPKSIRKRKTMSSKFNGIRKFRNRLFHHEAIAWNHSVLVNYRNELMEGIFWIDKGLISMGNDIFRVGNVLKEEKKNID